jgi:hypothetical protein
MDNFNYSPEANLLNRIAAQQNIAGLQNAQYGNASLYGSFGSYASDMARNACRQDFTAELRGPMSEEVLERLAQRNAARVKEKK